MVRYSGYSHFSTHTSVVFTLYEKIFFPKIKLCLHSLSDSIFPCHKNKKKREKNPVKDVWAGVELSTFGSAKNGARASVALKGLSL